MGGEKGTLINDVQKVCKRDKVYTFNLYKETKQC